MAQNMTSTDTARHAIALHLGAEDRYVDNLTAEEAFSAVLLAARQYLGETGTHLSEGGVLSTVDRGYTGGIPAFVTVALASLYRGDAVYLRANGHVDAEQTARADAFDAEADRLTAL